MKSRYTTIDIKSALAEIRKSEAIGLRVMNVYDIDNRTYLIRLVHGETKVVILVESGNRIHLTEYDWPKNMMPSGFSMKCRKHLKGRRLASVMQFGIDRIVDFTFGYDEAAYHFIVELYDRGNIILTDYEYNILQLLRMRTDADKDVKFAVREKYPINLAKQHQGVPSHDRVLEMFKNAKPGENLKRILNPNFVYGPAVLEHTLLSVGLKPNAKVPQQLDVEDTEVLEKIMSALNNSENILQSIEQSGKGYIIQKSEKKPKSDKSQDNEEILTYSEFHPLLYQQHSNFPYIEFPTFNKCVDEFFSKLESQKIDMKAIAMEKGALKRLENVKEDHKKRLEALKSSQDFDTRKAELIEINLPLVEKAIVTINSAIANQIDWEEIENIVKEAQSQQDPVASAIKSLNLQTNHIVLALSDTYDFDSSDESDGDSDDKNETKKSKDKKPKTIDVNIDLSQTAFANARGYHTKRRHAASKEEKTIQASKKALKSAEQKTKETLKEVQTAKMISKTRKANWFEKFYWFISSENYLVVGGRDQQQNELIVKRYLKAGDVYVHADLHGASSVIVKNTSAKAEIPPKTLNEAGTMAICYSAAWEARVVTSAWWVYHNQVSKTAPSGEYLTTGSFMIRGKKNYLPPSHLIMGFSVMFKLDESSVTNHANDRKVRTLEEDAKHQSESESTQLEDGEDDQEIDIGDDDTDEMLSPRSENADDSSPPQDENSEDNEIAEVDQDVNKTSMEKRDEEGEDGNGGSPQGGKTDDVLIRDSETPKEEGGNTDSKIKNENVNDNAELSQTKRNENAQDLTKEVEDLKIDDIGAEEQGKESEEEEEELEYPDTNIRLQHVSGDVFHLQRGTSTYSNDSQNTVEDRSNEQKDENRKPKLSKKQRRDMKKQRKQPQDGDQENNDEGEPEPVVTRQPQKPQKPPKESVQPQPAPLKRGQKKKMKKMKDKYKDQDDEDREMMQQILQSSGTEKVAKKKGKAAKVLKLTGVTNQQQHQKIKKSNLIPTDILHEEEASTLPPQSDVTKENEDDDEEEKSEMLDKDNANILDSLTGQPVEGDVLLYAIPACAPYNTMQSYKYKVKVTPGTGKRGKATKSAIHMFLQAKEATEWEKDLLKSLKDVDVSRNMPGKVKISAPNMQRLKKK